MGNDITFNKYELKDYTDAEEEKAIINLLEDLNIEFEKMKTANKLIENSRMATLNILNDSMSLNQYIKKESSKMEAILSNMNDSLYVIDLDEKIILFNSSAEKMFGWEKNEVIGKKDSEIFPKVRPAVSLEPDKYGLPHLIHNIWKNGKTINLPYFVLQKKNEGEVVVSISAAPIFDEKQNVIMGVITIRDMKREFEIDKAKTEFVSIASHQLRTPLAAIKWFSELILGGDAGKISDQQKDFLTQISDSTERMIDLVNSLLNVSRIETGRIIINPQPTDLVALAEKVIIEMKPIFEKRNQIFKLVKPQKELPNINIDPRLIFEVISNILTNASKYTPEKGAVTLNIEQVDTEILFRVSDTGYGIPAAQIHKVFEKFFRGENIMKHAPEGTGLGLYIVKAIVESSGGKVWFESKENEGTTFYFTLPLAGSHPKGGRESIELTKRFI